MKVWAYQTEAMTIASSGGLGVCALNQNEAQFTKATPEPVTPIPGPRLTDGSKPGASAAG